VRLKHKLISFDAAEMLEEAGLPTFEELRDKIIDGKSVGADELRLAGLGMAKPLIDLRITRGRIQKILEGITFPGIVFKKVEGGAFKYQGEDEQIESFELAETPFTIGQMRKLLELREEEVRAVFRDPKLDVDKVIQKSEGKIAEDVPQEGRDNCPLIYVNQFEARGLAELLGYKLPSERQWERAASGTGGLKRPWGNELSGDKAVYDDSGTRPVGSRPEGRSVEGISDLIGLVWEWSKEGVFRGGSWCSRFPEFLRVDCRGDKYGPEYRGSGVGFRLARP